jgi:hypothetical protein
MDPNRRALLAADAAPQRPRCRAFSRSSRRQESGKFYEHGSVRIYYEEAGSGFPLMMADQAGVAVGSRDTASDK